MTWQTTPTSHSQKRKQGSSLGFNAYSKADKLRPTSNARPSNCAIATPSTTSSSSISSKAVPQTSTHTAGFGNWEELKDYTYRVASIVGLISIRIFGCTSADSEKYAVALGHALQLTNILRDVGEDLDDRVRIYLPLNDMARFQYTERDLVARVYDGRFIHMMHYLAERAEAYYQEAISHIPECDKSALRAAEGMRRIYQGILYKMRADDFKVFEKRYSLPKWKKLYFLLGTQLGF